MAKPSTKAVAVLTCFAAMLTAAFIHHSLHARCEPISSKLVEEYTWWRAQYRIGLAATPSEQEYRLRMFIKNREYVQNLNEQYEVRIVQEYLPKPKGNMYELNLFSDLSEEEFEAQYLGRPLLNEEEEEYVSPISLYFEENPEIQINANTKLNLGSTDSYNVYNQGTCGSCWAFASINLAERKWFSLYGNKVQLSQQQVIDCDTTCNGCNGGLIDRGLNYINVAGISLAADYPYKAALGVCREVQVKKHLQGLFNVKTYKFDIKAVDSWINQNNYAGATINGLAVRFVSSLDDIFSPSSSDCSVKAKNSVVLIESSLKDNYITILNSWGSDWGNKGVKKIRPCSSDNYAGTGAQFYTY